MAKTPLLAWTGHATNMTRLSMPPKTGKALASHTPCYEKEVNPWRDTLGPCHELSEAAHQIFCFNFPSISIYISLKYCTKNKK
jgi:hypothetical protein